MTERGWLHARLAELDAVEQTDDAESFANMATTLFGTLDNIEEIVVGDPEKLDGMLNSPELFLREPGECDVVRVTLENGMTIALVGEPMMNRARFDVWTGPHEGQPQCVLSDHANPERLFQHWAHF